MRVVITLVMTLLLTLAVGCKKGGTEGGGGGDDPAALGQKIVANHVAMLDELAALVKDKPAPADLTPKLLTLKEKYIKLHVASGKTREAMKPEDRKAVDAAMRSGMFGIARDKQKVLVDASKEYRGKDLKVANEIGSLNILTQYASYELLKKQLPKEAERLSIK